MIRIVISFILFNVSMMLPGMAHAADFEAAAMTVPASALLEPGLLKGEHYKITAPVTVEGYMNHYTVDSEFGSFSVTGDRALRKLLREIDAIAELKKMTSLSTGTDAAVDAVADTGKSVVNLATNPVDSAKGASAGVGRFFKRTARTAKNVGGEVAESISESISDDETDSGNDNNDSDEPGVTSQLASSFLGIGAAQRELARELQVDPYSDNAILQAELKRVAQISGSVGKFTSMLAPIPSVIGTAASLNDMVWSLSPADLLIQNEEKLKELGYTDELIRIFFSNKAYSPTRQTAMVAALASLDNVKGRQVLLDIANAAETPIESQFIVRSALVARLYHETVEPIAELMSLPNGMVPAAVTVSGDGLIFAPLDQLLWTEEIATALEKVAKLVSDHGASDEQIMWIEGRISKIAMTQLVASGWVESTQRFDVDGDPDSEN